MMASPCDLVSLAAVQGWLGQTSDGVVLSNLIAQVSRAILSSLGRPNILPASYKEARDGDGRLALVLRNWPVIEVSQVLIDGREIQAAPAPMAGCPLGAGFLVESADPSPPGQMQALFLRGDRFHPGRGNILISYTSGYRIDAEIGVVPLAPGANSITAGQPYGAWGSDCGVVYSDGSALSAVQSDPSAGQYSVADGVYTFSPQDAGATVLLTYGYVPGDLAEAAMEWTAERYSYKSRIGQRSKSLGGQETVSFDLSAIPAYVATALQPYRRVAWPC